MTPEAQRIVIAEACGKTYDSGRESKPDYLNDLNAMHEAEKVLTPKQQSVFTGWLANKVKRDDMIWDYAHATAAQRAEAFLKAIGKWEESP